MNITKITSMNVPMAHVTGNSPIITDVQSALDLMADVKYNTGCTRIILSKESVCEDFFILSTRLAGEILQKYINYGIKLAVVGDYSQYTSKPLHDFIYESNHGRDVFFVDTLDDAIAYLSRS